MASNRVVQLVCIAVALLGIAGAGIFSTAASAEAGRAQLVYTDDASEDQTPEVALGVAMGAFRGLFVNYLWIRANRLKEDGKFHEAVELASTITKLQPRFPRVWSFHAWNLAYNISVKTQTAEERWQWVSAGIDLLRDQGIPKNPNAILLYRELAWIFSHKIQGFSDDANWYYKKAMAREWTIILGDPPRLPEDTEEAMALLADWFRPVASAPETLDGLYALEEAERLQALESGDDELWPPVDAQAGYTTVLEELVSRLDSEAGVQPDGELLRLIAIRLALSGLWADSTIAEIEELVPNLRELLEESASRRSGMDRISDELAEILEDARYERAWELLLNYARRAVIVQDYRMDPRFMLELMEDTGPFDWRHASSHGLYWALKGVERSLQRTSTRNFDTLNTDRITIQCMQELFRTGTIYYDFLEDEHFTTANLHWAPKYHEVLEALQERAGRSQDLTQRVFTTYGQGYENFLRDVVRLNYRLGRYEEAQRYYTELRTTPFLNLNDRSFRDETSLPLEQFVLRQVFSDERASLPYVAATEVGAAIEIALVNGLLNEDSDAWEAGINYAQQVHEFYFSRQEMNTTTYSERNRMEEMPRWFDEAAGLFFLRTIVNLPLSLIERSEIYDRAPLTMRQFAYDGLANWATIRQMPEPVLRALYPEPPNMEGFRAMVESRRAQDGRGDEALLNTEEQ